MHRSLLFAIAVAVTPQLMSCATLNQVLGATFQQPKLRFKTMHLKDVSFEDLTMDFEFEIENPNSVGVKLATIDYQLDFDGKQLFKGEQDKGVELKANGTSPLNVPFNIKFVDFVENLATFFSSKKEVPYALSAGFGLDTPVGVVRLPTKVDGDVPLPKLPEVSVQNVQLTDIGLTGADIAFNLNVANKSKFPVKLKEMLYNVQLAGISVSQGRAALPEVAVEQTAPVAIPIKVNFLSLGAAAVTAIKDKRLPYKFQGDVDLGLFKMPFVLEGNANL